MQRNSRQRASIIEYLRSTKEHPSAETVYDHLRREYPRISLGTVYRNLSLLASRGEINRFPSIDGVDHYDADTTLHYHFVCRCCGRIADLPMNPLGDLDRLAGIGTDAQIEGHSVTFYGQCGECQRSAKRA